MLKCRNWLTLFIEVNGNPIYACTYGRELRVSVVRGTGQIDQLSKQITSHYTYRYLGMHF